MDISKIPAPSEIQINTLICQVLKPDISHNYKGAKTLNLIITIKYTEN